MVRATVTATACANIAFVKYWGNLESSRRLPFNDSLSMNLDAATTTTTVAFDARLPRDAVAIDGRVIDGPGYDRVVTHLDHIRVRAGTTERASVTSANTFPMGTGIASSAAAFAALSVAGASAAGLDLAANELSALARLGSGSAARSIPGGFVQWRAAADDAACFAYSIAPPEHWDLRDIVAVVSREHKAVGSTDGHAAAVHSRFFAARQTDLRRRLGVVRAALLERDLGRLGPEIEAEALSLHAVAMTSEPPLLYWAPATIRLLGQVRRWRDGGLPVYFTLDAGPNVHLLCEAPHAAAVEARLRELDYVEFWIHNRPGDAARLVTDPPEAVSAAGR